MLFEVRYKGTRIQRAYCSACIDGAVFILEAYDPQIGMTEPMRLEIQQEAAA